MDPHELLTPQEVAQLFRVDPKTVIRWHRQGLLTAYRTLGNHRRYPAAQFEQYFATNPNST